MENHITHLNLNQPGLQVEMAHPINILVTIAVMPHKKTSWRFYIQWIRVWQSLFRLETLVDRTAETLKDRWLAAISHVAGCEFMAVCSKFRSFLHYIFHIYIQPPGSNMVSVFPILNGLSQNLANLHDPVGLSQSWLWAMSQISSVYWIPSSWQCWIMILRCQLAVLSHLCKSNILNKRSRSNLLIKSKPKLYRNKQL